MHVQKANKPIIRSNRPTGPAWSINTTTPSHAVTMINDEHTQTATVTTDTSMIVGTSENMERGNRDTTNTLTTRDNDMQVEKTPHDKPQQNKGSEDVTVDKFYWVDDEDNGAIGTHNEQICTQYWTPNNKE